MLTKESIEKAELLYEKYLQNIIPTEEDKFVKEQIDLSNDLIELAGLKLLTPNLWPSQIFTLAKFLIDDKNIKDWLSRVNNKAFW